MLTQNVPGFGSAAFITSGTLYVYGGGVGTNGADKGCRLGKVAPSSAQGPKTWTLFAGNENWSSKTIVAISIFSGNDILSVSWNNYLQSVHRGL